MSGAVAVGGPATARRPRLAMLFAFPPSHHDDGISRFADHLLVELQRSSRVEAVALGPRRFGAAPRRPLLQLLVGAELLVDLIRLRPDVVHVHEHPVLLGTALAFRALTMGRARVVFTVHTQPPIRRRWWKRVMLGWLMARCAAVTAVSTDTVGRLGDIASPLPRQVGVIHGAAEIEERCADDPALAAFRQRFGLLNTGPVLCQIGLNQVLKAKGALRMIEALPLVRAEFSDVRLLLVGDTPMLATLEQAAVDAGVADAVILTGWLSDVSVPLAVADIYTHVTLQDAGPLSVLEAMYCGKPVVAARIGGIPELIQDGVDGILVEPWPDQIAAALLDLLRHPERARSLGNAARETARRRFSWQRVAADFAPSYGLALESNAS